MNAHKHSRNGESGKADLGRQARYGVLSALAVCLVAGGPIGCSSVKQTKRTATGNQTIAQKAALSDIKIDPSEARGQYTSEFFVQEGEQYQLPEQWVSEARVSTAEIEARRAAAQAAVVSASADTLAGFAQADAAKQLAISEKKIDGAHAKKLEQVYAAKLAQMAMQADAQERAVAARAAHADAIMEATSLEWQSELQKMRLQAENEWSQAMNQHAQMLAERDAVKRRGDAAIAKMIKTADVTEQQANLTVRQLRSEAETIRTQSTAEVNDLQQQISTVQEQTAARVSELRQTASSIKDESEARLAQVRSQIQHIQSSDVEANFQLAEQSYMSDFMQVKADVEQMFKQTETFEQNFIAEVERRRAEAAESLEIARGDFQAAQKAIDSYDKFSRAEVSSLLSKAEKIEKQARNEFIRAEQEARITAAQATSLHQKQLAESEFKKIKAEAEAEAQRIREQVMRTLAEQASKGQKTVPGNTGPVEQAARFDQPAPVVETVQPKTPVVDPAHVAKFKTALGEAAKFRSEADATQREFEVTVSARRTGLQAWWAKQQAGHEALLAATNAYEQQQRAKVDEMYGHAEAMLIAAGAEMNRSKVNAEASQREALAQVENLKAERDALEIKSTTTYGQLMAEADTLEKNGASQVRSLQATREATLRRGQAQARKMLAEADSLEQSQRAVVAQMRQEIESAQQMLNAEMVRLAQAADSFLQIAEANYDEAKYAAETFAMITEANTDELSAANQAARKMAEADVEYMRKLAAANTLVADAQVKRAMADAAGKYGVFEGQDQAVRAKVMADARIAGATASEQFAVARAQEMATVSVFDSRIAMTKADRDRAFAQQYLSQQQEGARIQQLLAAADAYRELSQHAMAELDDKARDFEVAAQQNWDYRLAMPVTFPTPQNPAELSNQADAVFSIDSIEVADVPVNDFE